MPSDLHETYQLWPYLWGNAIHDSLFCNPHMDAKLLLNFKDTTILFVSKYYRLSTLFLKFNSPSHLPTQNTNRKFYLAGVQSQVLPWQWHTLNYVLSDWLAYSYHQVRMYLSPTLQVCSYLEGYGQSHIIWHLLKSVPSAVVNSYMLVIRRFLCISVSLDSILLPVMFGTFLTWSL